MYWTKTHAEWVTEVRYWRKRLRDLKERRDERVEYEGEWSEENPVEWLPELHLGDGSAPPHDIPEEIKEIYTVGVLDKRGK